MFTASSLGKRFAVGVVLMCAMVLGLMLIGESLLRESAQRQQDLVEQQVRPLARLHALQLQLARIRALESEITKQQDVFAVADRVSRIDQAVAEFTRQLDAFARTAREDTSQELLGFQQQWRRYRADLAGVTEAAARMDMVAAEKYVAFLTGPRYDAIAAHLKRIADGVEGRTDGVLERARHSATTYRQMFLLVSGSGVLAVGLILAMMARSVLRRLARLNAASRSVADGQTYLPAGLAGGDELAALGAAFDQMQQRVAERERELRRAYADVEHRVHDRTADLRRANEELVREVAVREEAQARLRLMSEALEQSPVGVMILDMRGRVAHANRAYLDRSGVRLREVVGQRPLLYADPAQSENLFRDLWTTVLGGNPWSREIESGGRDAPVVWERLQASPVRDAEGAVIHALLIREDISVRKAQEQQILYQAHYDSLTGLPNRALAGDRLRQIIGRSARNQRKAVLAFLDLDDFKKVNDNLGHDAGDELLRHAARRLTETARAEDTVARLGGDEFVVIMGEIRYLADAEAIARKIVSAFAEPIVVAGVDLVVSASIGLAVYPNDGEDAGALMRHADLAMYEAKSAGRNGYRFFDQAIHDSSVQQMAIERQLRRAIERGELRLAYQPVWGLADGALIGAEALLRWENAERGPLHPDQFVNIAERTGLIVDIGEWVLDEALRQLAAWRSRSERPFHMAVNVSPRQFRGDRLPVAVARCVAMHGVPPGSLHLEVTEGLLIDDPPQALAVLEQLKAIGVRIAMDDFGTGYSSLSYLRRYPFELLKIDREFVNSVSHRAGDRALVSSAIRLGAGLGLEVVAEGVETREQLDFLRSEGCQAAQGFLLGRPLPADEFERRWLQRKPVTALVSDETPDLCSGAYRGQRA